MELVKEFWLCFLPLFVAVDPIGLLPIFLGLTEDLDPAAKRRAAWQSMFTAAGVALAFVIVGPAVLQWIGITISDFLIAGGVLLFVIAMSDLVGGEKLRFKVEPESLGAVPIGVPLVTGPAVLTTSVIMINQHGLPLTGVCVVLNVLIAGTAFLFAEPVNRILGRAGSRTLSKIFCLLLACIAVMFVRKGILGVVSSETLQW